MKKPIFLTLIMILFCIVGAKAQNGIVVQKTDNTATSFDLQTNGGIYFSSNTMTVIDNQGISTSYAISDIEKIYFESLSSISEINNNENVFLYPNPAKDYIKIANLNGKTKVKIFSLDGKMLYNNDYFLQSSIDISSLKEGLYVIKVDNKTLKFSKL